MKILYITNCNHIRKIGGFYNDYLNDLLFHGLYELQQEGVIKELVDCVKISHLYKDNEATFDKRTLWGKGFSQSFLIHGNGDDVDRSDILNKIRTKYYDLVIYGAINRIKDYWGEVNKYYPPSKIVLIDGADEPDIIPGLHQYPYFKRELQLSALPPNLHPISFAIPECKILPINYKKEGDFATVIPGELDTYIFEDEQSYYDNYNKSFYGMTCKKAGWDCMRHYEILAAGCIPWFSHIQYMPMYTMFNFPTDIVLEGMNEVYGNEFSETFNEEKYFSVLEKLHTFTKQHLTTKALARYVINTTTDSKY